MLQLSFTDFLEVIVRMATLKALPTDEEIAEADVEDAGDFLLRLRSSDPLAYKHFLTACTPTFGQPPRQGVHRSVEHVCNLIMRTIAAVVATAGDPRKAVKDMDNLTLEDVRLFKEIGRRGGSSK